MRSIASPTLVALAWLAGCGGSSPKPNAMPPPVASTVAASTSSDAGPPAEPVPLGPLPRDARPTHEALALSIDPDRDRFQGIATLDVVLDRPRDVLWLHGRGLHVSSADALLPSGEHVGATWTEADPTGVAKVVFARALSGKLTLTVAYDAAYDPSLVGVYRTTVAGAHAVFSKFEAIYARRAFPCFDEPAFKVPFDVTLTVPAGAVALGNMPVASTALAGSNEIVTFATTPLLPTYLVAFAVGPFDALPSSVPPSALRPTPLPFAVDAMRGRIDDTAFAAAESPALLAEEERYYGVAFPFPKLDLLAVPDFQSGAMENAGLITFRDSSLLVDAHAPSLGQRIGVLETIAHEDAHQWFGDLVTMAWWDDLWLNESFASFIATRTLVAVKPEVAADLIAVQRADDVMRSDGLASARRIRQPIASTDDITNAFDGITYQKGEAVLSMMERFVGDDAFRQGLHDYLTAHAGGNATTGDLVSALSKASGRDLAPVFASFLDQPGVPLVSARATCDAGKGAVALSETRWLPLGSKADASLSWNVPVCLRAGVGAGASAKVETACTLLEGGGATVPLSGCPSWVMPNADARGYYRFVLDQDGLGRLRDEGVARLTTAERMALAGDLDALFRSATLSTADVLAAMEPLARDAHGAVATSPTGVYAFADERLLDDDGRAKLRAYVRKLYAPAVTSLGWRKAPGESTWRSLERSALLGFLARKMDDPGVLAEGVRRGRLYIGIDGDRAIHPDTVDPDLVPLALASAVRAGTAEVFDDVLEDFSKSTDATQRRAFLLALANTRDPALASRALDLALDPRLRKNERLLPITTLLDAPATRERAWAWVVAHFDALVPMLPDRYAGYVPLSVRFCDAARADEVNAFFTPRVPGLTGGTRNLAQAVEGMKSCAELAAQQRASAAAFFSGR